MNEEEYIVPYLVVKQPIGTFYLSTMKATELLKCVDILRRGLTSEEQKNIQRRLDPKSQRDIANFIKDPDATFPTPIIVSVYSESVTIDEESKELKFNLIGGKSLGEVLDGQHRLEGMKLAASEGMKETLNEFDVPIVFVLAPDPDEKAYLFSIINSTQTQVPSSLIFDLFGLQRVRSPQKTCHEIAQALNAKEGSPFYRGLKMLGTKQYDSEILTQGAFAKYLLLLISKNPDEDARNEKLGKPLTKDDSLPFRSFYEDKKDAVIAKVMENYFTAVAEEFKNEWTENPKEFLLRKTAGYSALMTVLKELWNKKISKTHDASQDYFKSVAKKMREGLGGRPLTSSEFGSSEQGAKTLSKILYSKLETEDTDFSSEIVDINSDKP